ncbi:MAG: FAD:protein FMN transferase [Treponema sp.]|nr:FAD:protein FMN transferase [Treponema sp.]
MSAWAGVLLALLLAACSKTAPAPVSESAFFMGTVCSLTLYAPPTVDVAPVFQAVFTRFDEIEHRMSANIADTDIGRVNQNAGQAAIVVHAETRALLERALYYAELSDGAFDPTVGPLVKLWAIGTETPHLPSQDEIAAALALVNWRDVGVDPAHGAAFLAKTGMALDLGAIAKGYAADEAARILAKAGVTGAIIDLGGNVCAYGIKNYHEPDTLWRIGVQNPLDGRGAYIGVLALQNKSVVTSGIYERYAELNGTRYHHILSTRDGYPVQNGLLSVTIIAASSTAGDALSTTAFALGYERGRALIEALDDVEAIFVFADKTIRVTSGCPAMFTLSDAAYRLAD